MKFLVLLVLAAVALYFCQTSVRSEVESLTEKLTHQIVMIGQ